MMTWIRRQRDGAVGRQLIRRTPRLCAAVLRGVIESGLVRAEQGDPELVESLALAFPEKSLRERVALVRQCLADELIDGMWQHRLELLEPAALRRAVEEMRTIGGEHLAAAQASGRPIIYVTAHYGAFVLAALKAAQEIPARRLNFFYNPAARNEYAPTNDALLERMNAACGIIHNDRRGVVTAMKCLARGESLCLVADQVNPTGELLFVPFFGRFYAAMPGTAFFAERSEALILPCFARNGPRGALLEVHEAIDVRQLAGATSAETQFQVTAAIFAVFERQLRAAPSPWRYWRGFRSLALRSPLVPRSAADVQSGVSELAALLAHDPAAQSALRALEPAVAANPFP